MIAGGAVVGALVGELLRHGSLRIPTLAVALPVPACAPNESDLQRPRGVPQAACPRSCTPDDAAADCLLVSSANQRSTRFSQELDVV